MGILSTKKVVKVDPIEEIRKESEAAIGIFTETKEKLGRAITSAEIEEEKEQAIIDAAQARKKNLEEIKTKNVKFIGKIDQLFE